MIRTWLRRLALAVLLVALAVNAVTMAQATVELRDATDRFAEECREHNGTVVEGGPLGAGELRCELPSGHTAEFVDNAG